jgi:pSer/pThr/pTyr-binding forkhead associated (FHA) protein
MARLVVQSAATGTQVIELHLGSNRLGRSADNHFQIEHPTVSATHCEIVLADQRVAVRDCDSTNGTYVNGERIKEAALAVGQVLRLGDVELLVENTDVVIAIPKFEVPRPAPPVVLSDGSVVCPRHPRSRVTYQCTHCREVMCDACVHRLRRRGGKVRKLCPLCSHPCVALGPEKKAKRSLLGLWHKTVKLPFLRAPKTEEEE